MFLTYVVDTALMQRFGLLISSEIFQGKKKLQCSSFIPEMHTLYFYFVGQVQTFYAWRIKKTCRSDGNTSILNFFTPLTSKPLS